MAGTGCLLKALVWLGFSAHYTKRLGYEKPLFSLEFVFHWHKSDEATTRAILDAGFFVSLTPEVAWRERDRELARLAPLDQIVVETDGPHPHERVFPGRQTEPWMVSEAIAAIAGIKRLDREEVASATSINARNLFALDKAVPARTEETDDGESNSSG